MTVRLLSFRVDTAVSNGEQRCNRTRSPRASVLPALSAAPLPRAAACLARWDTLAKTEKNRREGAAETHHISWM